MKTRKTKRIVSMFLVLAMLFGTLFATPITAGAYCEGDASYQTAGGTYGPGGYLTIPGSYTDYSVQFTVNEPSGSGDRWVGLVLNQSGSPDAWGAYYGNGQLLVFRPDGGNAEAYSWVQSVNTISTSGYFSSFTNANSITFKVVKIGSTIHVYQNGGTTPVETVTINSGNTSGNICFYTYNTTVSVTNVTVKPAFNDPDMPSNYPDGITAYNSYTDFPSRSVLDSIPWGSNVGSIIDGNKYTFWDIPDAWDPNGIVVIDLGKSVSISYLATIAPSYEFVLNSCNIYVGDTPNHPQSDMVFSGTTIGPKPQNNNTLDWVHNTFSPRTGRYVTLVSLSTNLGRVPRISELVLGHGVPKPYVSQGFDNLSTAPAKVLQDGTTSNVAVTLDTQLPINGSKSLVISKTSSEFVGVHTNFVTNFIGMRNVAIRIRTSSAISTAPFFITANTNWNATNINSPSDAPVAYALSDVYCTNPITLGSVNGYTNSISFPNNFDGYIFLKNSSMTDLSSITMGSWTSTAQYSISVDEITSYCTGDTPVNVINNMKAYPQNLLNTTRITDFQNSEPFFNGIAGATITLNNASDFNKSVTHASTGDAGNGYWSNYISKDIPKPANVTGIVLKISIPANTTGIYIPVIGDPANFNYRTEYQTTYGGAAYMTYTTDNGATTTTNSNLSAGFNGYVFLALSPDKVNLSALQLGFMFSGSASAYTASATIDDIYYYTGTNYSGLISEIGQQTNDGMTDSLKMKYGTFVHYTSGGGVTYSNGTWEGDLNRAANGFDAQGFANDVEAAGSQYVVFTAWHEYMEPQYPSEKMNTWRAGHSTTRDLINDMINAVKAKGIKVYFYTHPYLGYHFSSAEKAFTGWYDGDVWPQANYDRWNDFLSDIYGELLDRYGSRIDGIFFDEGDGGGGMGRATDFGRLQNIIKTRYPQLLTIQNFYGTTYAQDIGMQEYGAGWCELQDPTLNIMPGYEIPITAVIGNNWSANTASDVGVLRISAEQMFKYTVLQAGTNTKGMGVAWAAGPYVGGGWQMGINEAFHQLGDYVAPVAESIKNTLPSTSYPTVSGTSLSNLPYGIVATKSLDNNYEYIHVLIPPSGSNTISLPVPTDGKNFGSAILLSNGHPVSVTQTAGYLNLTLQSGDTWNALDTVIKLSVGSAVAPSATYKLINDAIPDITYSGAWGYDHWMRNAGDFEDNVHITYNNNDYFTYTFTGTGIDYISGKNSSMGTGDVYIDNVYQGTVNGSVNTGNSAYYEPRQVLFTKKGLAYGTHTIKVVKTSGTYLTLDALGIYNGDYLPVAQPLSYYSTTNNTSTDISYSGSSWFYNGNRVYGDYLGDVNAALTNGDFCEYTFNGTGIDFFTAKSNSHGDIDVYIDGVYKQRVSAYSTSGYIPLQAIYSIADLPAGSHTIKLVKVSGTYMLIDAFNVYGPKNINDTDSKITYSGTFDLNSNRGLGDYRNDLHVSLNNGAYVEYTFFGSGIDFISPKSTDQGEVDIYLDNNYVARINTYTPGYVPQQTIYRATNLTAGNHTIKVVKVNGTYFDVDSFKVYSSTPEYYRINNTDSSIAYTGNWSNQSGRGLGDLNDDLAYTTGNGEYFVATFYGTGASILDPKQPGGFEADIYVDNVYQCRISNNSANGYLPQQSVYSIDGLTPGTHTIKAVKVSGTYMNLDGLDIFGSSISPASVPVTGIALNYTSTTVDNPGTRQLTATITPSNAANKSITWSSSNTAVATVDSNGLVTGVSLGSAVIKATTVDGGFAASCNVTVNYVPVTSVSLNSSTLTIGRQVTSQLIATVNPSNATDKSVTWSSSNTAVATVSSSGVVTGVTAGTAVITVTTANGGKTATCTVTVKRYDPTKYYKITYDTVSTLAMDSAGTGINGAVKNVTYTGANSQQWQIIETTDANTFKIVNKATGYALKVNSTNNSTGKAIIQSTYTNINSMNFTISESTGYLQIYSKLGTSTYIKSTGATGGSLVTAASAVTTRWDITLLP